MGWQTLVVLGGNQASLTFESVIWGWQVALSRNSRTWRPCCFILPLKAISHSSISCDVIHAFLFDCHSTGRFLLFIFLKHLGLLAFPITRGFSISPVMNPQRKTVSLSFDSFPPEHFSPFRQSVLLGSARKNKPVSSPFAILQGSYPSVMVDSFVFHSAIVSSLISFYSPQTSL